MLCMGAALFIFCVCQVREEWTAARGMQACRAAKGAHRVVPCAQATLFSGAAHGGTSGRLRNVGQSMGGLLPRSAGTPKSGMVGTAGQGCRVPAARPDGRTTVALLAGGVPTHSSVNDDV